MSSMCAITITGNLSRNVKKKMTRKPVEKIPLKVNMGVF